MGLVDHLVHVLLGRERADGVEDVMVGQRDGDAVLDRGKYLY